VADDHRGERALQLWLDQKDDLLAGRKPRPKIDGTLTVENLVNRWLDAKHKRMDSGELSPLTWRGYRHLGAIIVDALGRTRAAADIGPDDFGKLRAVFASKWGPAKLATAVTHTRAVFKWGYQAGLLATPQRFGDDFGKPSTKTMRQARAAKGPRMFQQSDLLAIIAAADVNAGAMVLLGINGGIGNTDLALLPISSIDIDGGWLNLPRAKTGINRRIPLWSETVDAIRDVLAHRPEPKRGNEGLLFLTQTGANLVKGRSGSLVAGLFQKAATAAGVTGRVFYDLRRTFATVADGARDPVAVSALLGHAPKSGDMTAIYRQAIDDTRLRNVVDHVHDWLFPVATDVLVQEDVDVRGQAAEDPLAVAVARCRAAIEASEGPTRKTLESCWLAELENARQHPRGSAAERIVEVWGAKT